MPWLGPVNGEAVQDGILHFGRASVQKEHCVLPQTFPLACADGSATNELVLTGSAVGGSEFLFEMAVAVDALRRLTSPCQAAS